MTVGGRQQAALGLLADVVGERTSTSGPVVRDSCLRESFITMAQIVEMLQFLTFLLVLLALCGLQLVPEPAGGEQIPLASILPKLEAIHEDAKSLLIKNAELKGKILTGLQAQAELHAERVKSERVKSEHPLSTSTPSDDSATPPSVTNPATAATTTATAAAAVAAQLPSGEPVPQVKSKEIDYRELEEFNKWVDKNLEYAVKNTKATAETLKEEAQLNNGNVEYSEQSIKDGIEGVKYWQSAVIFQDKTLNNEKFESKFD